MGPLLDIILGRKRKAMQCEATNAESSDKDATSVRSSKSVKVCSPNKARSSMESCATNSAFWDWSRLAKSMVFSYYIPPRAFGVSSKQESQCPNVKNGLTVTSIIAVHGLGGDWEHTWTDDTSGKMWLRDFLPEQLSSARVWSFGYDSAYALSTSETDIDDAARSLIDRLDGERQDKSAKRRPIIFIAHSLGEIVVKRVSLKFTETLNL